MATPAAVLSILVRANTSQATTGLLRVNQQLGTTEKGSKRAAQAVSGLVKGLALAGGVGAAAGIGFAVKKAADFEAQLSSLGSVADASAKQMERFRKQALKAGAETKFSALEAAEAQTELAKGGLKVEQIMRGGLKSALALAAAGEMELADAATATVNAMKLFGLRGKDAMKVADGFATAANSTTSDVSDFAFALKMGGSAAKAAGLSFVETTAALEALAEMGIKGSDAGTSLKAALVQIAAPTLRQEGAMKDLGLRFFDAEGNMKSLTKTAAMLRDRLGDLTNEQRLNAVKTIAGTDGMRALLALYDAGPDKIAKFQRELNKEGTAAEVARRKQDNLKGSLEQLSGSIETLAIQIGTGMIPIFRKGADELTRFANDVGKIVARKDLSLGEKLQKSLELAEVRAKPWIDKLVAAIEEANLPQRIGNLISAAVPVIASAAAKAAPIVVAAFIKGWLAADVWGRLAVGAWLLARLGGPPAFMRVGGTAGAAMGAGMATGVARSGLKGKLGGLMRAWGPTLGAALALTLGPELVKKLTSQPLTGRIPTDPRAGTPERVTQAAEAVKRASKNLSEMNRKLQEAGDRWRAISRNADSPKQRDWFLSLAKAVDKVQEPAKRAQHAIHNMSRRSSDSIQQLRTNVRFNTRAIKNALDTDSKAGKDALQQNFRAAVKNIRRSMREGTVTTREGTREIERLMVSALMDMGFTRKQALRYRAGQDTLTGKRENAPLVGKRRGGPIDTGAPSGDSVPAMLERGEYVLNRNAVRKVGKRALDKINFANAPRFQGGGIVELLHPFNDPEGHGGSNSHLHIAHASVQAIVALGKRLQKLGWLVGEHPAFGGVQGRHAAGGYHYSSQAIDVNWPNAGEEGAKIRALLPLLGGAGGLGAMTAPKLKRLMVDGPDSALKGIVQGALDSALSGAQSVVDSAASSMTVEGAEAGVSADGNVEAIFANVARRLSRSKIATRALGMAGYAESGMRDLAGGHSTSSGALQLLSSTASSMGINPHDEGAISSAFLQRGFYGKGGANKLAASGLPAHLVAQGVQGSAFSDGSNYLAQAGPARAWMSRYGLRRGGRVGTAGGHTAGLPAGLSANGAKGFGLGKALQKVRTGNSPKLRRRAVSKLLDKIRGIGLPKGVQDALAKHSSTTNTYGEYADRAGALTDEGAITDALQAELERRQVAGKAFPDGDQQKMVEQMLGRVGGRTQLDWLGDQLGALFNWRNKIVEAEQIIVARREQTTKLIEQARKRLKTIREQIAKAAKTRKRVAKRLAQLEKRLEKLKEHPKRNRRAIKELRRAIKPQRAALKDLDKHIRIRGRMRDALAEKIIPELSGKRSALNAARGDLLANLEEVQGVGSPMGRLSVLPGVGGLGGRIFDVQMRMKDLTDKPLRVVADPPDPPETPDAAPSGPQGISVDQLTDFTYLFRSLLKAFGTARVDKTFGATFANATIPGLATGGIIERGGWAVVGEKGPELAHLPSGSSVYSNSQSRGMLGGVPEVRVFIGNQEIRDIVRVEVVERDRASASAWRAGVVSK